MGFGVRGRGLFLAIEIAVRAYRLQIRIHTTREKKGALLLSTPAEFRKTYHV